MIKHEKRFKQKVSFKGVGNSKIHPSDIDAVLEFDNKYLIIFEVKLKGVPVPFGQELLFKRIVDCWQKTNGDAFLVYCQHETETDEIVNMENTTVIGAYHKSKKFKRNENIKDFLVKLADKYRIKKLQDAL
jgi:hypothetical protein